MKDADTSGKTASLLPMIYRLNPWVRFASVGVLLASFIVARSACAACVSAALTLIGAFLIARRATVALAGAVLLPFAFFTCLVTLIVCTDLFIRTKTQIIAPGFYLLQFARVAGISAVTVALIGSLSPTELLAALRGIRVPLNWCLLLISPLVLVEAFREHARTIIDARLAQGHVKRRTRFAVALQLIPSLRVLTAYAFVTAIERHDMWLRDGVIDLIVLWGNPPAESAFSGTDATQVIFSGVVASANLQLLPCTLF